MTILVVEDETQVAEMLERILGQFGNRCVRAPDTDAADRLLRGGDVDAVTLDLGMPGPDGLSWLERIAAVRPDLARRTLVITGRHLDAPAVERLTRCGAGVLAKPFTIDHLRDALCSQVGRPIERAGD